MFPASYVELIKSAPAPAPTPTPVARPLPPTAGGTCILPFCLFPSVQFYVISVLSVILLI